MHRLRILCCSVSCRCDHTGLKPSKDNKKSVFSSFLEKNALFFFIWCCQMNEEMLRISECALGFTPVRSILFLSVSVPFLQIRKFRKFRKPQKIYRSDRAVSLFSDNNIRNALFLGIFIIIIISVYEHYHIRVLLDSS